MTDLPVLPSAGTTVDVVQFRPALAAMVEPIVARIQAEVEAYAGPAEGRRHQLMVLAASTAARAMGDTGQARDSSLRKVNELFHRMGWGEAQDGFDTTNLERAIDIATRIAWDHLSDRAVALNAPSAVLQSVTTTLYAFTDHLKSQLLAGHATGIRHPLLDEDTRRGQLFDFFQNNSAGRISPGRPLGAEWDLVRRQAAIARWPLPTDVCVVGMTFTTGDPRLRGRPELLQRIDGNRLLVISPAHLAAELAIELASRLDGNHSVVTSWSVPVTEAGSSLIWAMRALDLVDLEVIPRAPVVRCEDHVSQLWLHSEPSMRRRLCQDLLEPLLAESPNSREILSETLLIWLETRDSAPAIAARLDVHPQTIRYRWRRINEIFGDALHDPEFVVQTTLVLKASVPLWKGGDQSDFELFRDNQETDS